MQIKYFCNEPTNINIKHIFSCTPLRVEMLRQMQEVLQVPSEDLVQGDEEHDGQHNSWEL